MATNFGTKFTITRSV